MSKNTILLIVAGVAAYLIWKKYGKSSGVGSIIPEGQNLSKAWLKEQSAYQQVPGTYPAMSTGSASVASPQSSAPPVQNQGSGRMDQRFGNAVPSSIPGPGMMDQRFGNAAYRQSAAADSLNAQAQTDMSVPAMPMDVPFSEPAPNPLLADFF